MKQLPYTEDLETYKINKPRQKDYYSFVYNILKKRKFKNILDLGTASGDFLYFLPDHINGTGIDKNKNLISIAKRTRQKKNLNFFTKNFEKDDLNFKNNKNSDFDVVTIFGTMVTLSDYKKILKKMINLKPKLIIINDFYNINDVDTVMGYKQANITKEMDYNFAYKILSKKTIYRILKDLKVKNFLFKKYHTKTKVLKSRDYLRNYHETLSNGEVVFTNGLGLILRGYNLIIELE
jgi:ubiquinone/menaquinone biosynthesis C-methylase UbiE